MRPIHTAVMALLLAPPMLNAAPMALEGLPTRHPVWWPAGADSPEPIPFTPAGRGEGAAEVALPLPSDYPVADRAQWTVIVYMDGDNDLERYVVEDLKKELGAVGSTDAVQVLALADRAEGYAHNGGDWTGTLLFHVSEGMRGTADEAIADLGERNLGDPQTLTEVLTFAQAHFPANKTLLALWDHGWGWRPDNTMIDETSGDALDIDELAQALDETGGVDVIGYDACLMATMEIQASLRPHAQALVASEDYVGWDGFDYGQLLSALNADPTMEPLDVAAVLAQSMSGGDSRTASAVALDPRWDRLEAAVDGLAAALIDALPTHRGAIDAARQSAQRFAGDMAQRDLMGLALALQDGVEDPAVRRAATQVAQALSDVTVYEWHRRPYDGGAYGTSIYWPANAHDRYSWYTLGDRTFAYYQDALPLSHRTRWDDLLEAWFEGS